MLLERIFKQGITCKDCAEMRLDYNIRAKLYDKVLRTELRNVTSIQFIHPPPPKGGNMQGLLNISY
jgi:hypothetical protein